MSPSYLHVLRNVRGRRFLEGSLDPLAGDRVGALDEGHHGHPRSALLPRGEEAADEEEDEFAVVGRVRVGEGVEGVAEEGDGPVRRGVALGSDRLRGDSRFRFRFKTKICSFLDLEQKSRRGWRAVHGADELPDRILSGSEAGDDFGDAVADDPGGGLAVRAVVVAEEVAVEDQPAETDDGVEEAASGRGIDQGGRLQD